MSRQPPPIYEELSDENGKAKTPWILFFNQIFTGDNGTAWTPTFTGLTTVGTPTITGRYKRIGSGLVYFTVVIAPATSTSSVAGTTFLNNFPLNITNSGGCAVSVTTTSALGTAVGGTKTIYMPVWTGITTPVTISGLIEAT